MQKLSLFLSILLSSCVFADKSNQKQATDPNDIPSDEDESPFQDDKSEFQHLEGLRFFTCIQFEREDWGQEISRCKIQVLFFWPDENHQAIPPKTLPDPGECIYYEAEDKSEPPLMVMQGIDAGISIQLQNDHQELLLQRKTTSELGIVYEFDNCTEDTFPFGEVFDMEISGSDLDDGVPAFEVEEAIYFGQDMHFVTSYDELTSHNLEESWNLRWDWTGESFNAEEAKTWLQISNRAEGDEIDGLDCTPFDGRIVISPASFSHFQIIDTQNWEGRFDFKKTFFGEEKMLPWNEAFRSTAAYRMVGVSNWE